MLGEEIGDSDLENISVSVSCTRSLWTDLGTICRAQDLELYFDVFYVVCVTGSRRIMGS